jgi:hypothetical protein
VAFEHRAAGHEHLTGTEPVQVQHNLKTRGSALRSKIRPPVPNPLTSESSRGSLAVQDRRGYHRAATASTARDKAQSAEVRLGIGPCWELPNIRDRSVETTDAKIAGE